LRPRRNDRNAASQLEPASRGNAGGMNLSPPFGRRRIGCVVGRKTSNCSRAFHRIQQRARVASRTVPLRWGKPASGAQQAGLSVLVSCGANCASLRVPQARVSGSRRRPSADARGSSQAGARASHTCARASSAHLRPAPIASRSSRVSMSTAIGFSPTTAIGSPHRRPSFLPTGGHRFSPSRWGRGRRRGAERVARGAAARAAARTLRSAASPPCRRSPG
jgi:hypothetical protein